MPRIGPDEAQAGFARASDQSIEIVDRDGNSPEVVAGSFTRDDIVEARRRASSEGPWHSTREVIEHLSRQGAGDIERR